MPLLRTRTILPALALGALFLVPGLAQAAQYEVDTAHSEVGFKVRHLGISWVRGDFTDYVGEVMYDDAHPENTVINVTIQATSVDTGNENRDNHLRNPDFFEVETYPTITFASKSTTVLEDGSLDVLGDLTIHGVTREVVMQVTDISHEVTVRDTIKRAASATLMIDRKEFGIMFDSVLGTGEASVGDEVYIELEIELNKKVPTAVPAG